nr:C2 calcium/lipid-binding domain, CaLB [Tanacetum cinerariifolium]
MDDDLFTYKIKIPRLSNIPCDKKEGDDSDDDKETIGDTWNDADMECDPSDIEFAEWLASKFYNYMTMDRYTENALWIYWTRGEHEVELTDEEFSNPDDENLIDKDGVAVIFRIETDIFDFETPI